MVKDKEKEEEKEEERELEGEVVYLWAKWDELLLMKSAAGHRIPPIGRSVGPVGHSGSTVSNGLKVSI